jgi:hypothetical protein
MTKELTWQELDVTIGAGNIVAVLPYNGRILVACERSMFMVEPETDTVTQIKFKSDE